MKQILAALAGAAVLTVYGVTVLAQNQPQQPPTPEQYQQQLRAQAREMAVQQVQLIDMVTALEAAQKRAAECAPAKDQPAKK